MNLKAAAQAGLLAVWVFLPACREKVPPPPPPAPSEPPQPLAPWAWYRLGGLLVVTGEVDRPIDLHLKGRYMNDRMHAEPGPLRWELYAPPAGEVAELRSSDGILLARWSFDGTATASAEVTPPPPPLPIAKATPAPLPKPRRPAPTPAAPAIKPVRPVPPAPEPPPRLLELTALPALPAKPAKPRSVPPPTQPTPLRPPIGAVPGVDWPGAGEAFNLIRGMRGSHWVCLTFDGGSTSEAALDVLDALKERGIRTTIFLTGTFIQRYPELVRRMDADGHEIGNHTMDHPHLAPGMRRDPRWTKERVQQQLLQADAALLAVLGRPMDPYWRAPYGEHTAEIRKWAEELGYRHVGWSEGADTLDWATVKERKLYRTGNAILDRLFKRMRAHDGDGLIVLMHLGSARPEADRPARVLGPFLDQALEEGWNFVNVSAYLKETGRAPWNSSNRLAMLGRTQPRQ